MSEIMYVCGGRSFRSNSLGRKIAGVVQSWKELGHSVTHVCGGDINDPIEKSEYGSQSHYSKWYRNIASLSPVLNSISEIRDIRHDRKMVSNLLSHVRLRRPDVIWERSSRLHSAGLEVAKQIGVPYVLEWKDNLIPYDLSLFKWRALAIEHKKNNESNCIVVESGVLKNSLSIEGIDPRKIIVAHNAVDLEQFARNNISRDNVRSRLGVMENEVLVGYLGSYAFYHDAIRLVKAANLIRINGCENVKILMMGAGKDYFQSRELAVKLGLLGSTLLMEPGVPAAQVPDVLSSLDIAVLPGSTDIICPIKIQEYMASGLATIAPDFICNREVISDGENGCLFSPGSEISLANKIIELCNDSDLRNSLGVQARISVSQRFTWAATWGNALTSALSRTSSR
jgi:glycosyltransferase involved in cell wall biosynthesis